MQFLSSFLEWLFPSRCVRCRKRGTYLCATCFQSLPKSEPPKDTFIHALLSYRHPIVKRSLWLLKYRNKIDIANLYGRALYETFLEIHSEEHLFGDRSQPIIIPIPVTKGRRRERGYNQAELLAKAMKSYDTENIFIYEPNVLKKIATTRPQATIKHRGERLNNLRGAFQATDPEKIFKRNIILIDDITTTGATLKETRRALKAAGAKHILAGVVAH